MEAAEYRTLFDLEEQYWWFRALRSALVDVWRREGAPAHARVLDAGCGTGMLATALQGTGARVCAFDLSAEAPQYWRRRGLSRACRASINQIPFASDSFDAAFSVDVLESDGVDEREACRELLRVVKPGGCVFLIVPAYDALMSPEHHKAVRASRRYTRARIRALASELPARVVRITHLFMTVFPAVAAYRLWRRADAGVPDEPRSELRPLPRWIDSLLFAATGWERLLLSRINLPFGSSILVVLQRPVA